MAARDYKNTPRPRSRSRSRGAKKHKQPSNLPGFVLIVLILALGIGLGLIGPRLLGIATRRFDTVMPPVDQSQSRTTQDTEQAPSKPDKTHFDFYEMLPDFQVVIPEQDKKGTSKPHHEPVETPGAYVLQVASVKRLDSADKMKARLALLGLRSHVQQVTISGEVWHRVRIGPMTDLDKLNRTRKTLAEHEIKPLMIEINANSSE